MKRLYLFFLLAAVLLMAGASGAKAGKHYLKFKTEDYCAANWNAGTSTFTWGLGGWNPEWVFMSADGISGDLSGWTHLHLHVSDFTNASARKLTIVFKKNDGSYPPNGPTRKFVVSPDASGDIDLSLEGVKWGRCDITNIQDLTIYGCTRDDNSQNASVKITDAYYISQGGPVNEQVDICVDGETRSFRLYVPKGCQPGAPLVVAMHGASGSMDNQSPHFNNIADTAKFVVAYPQGRLINFPVFGGTVTGWDATGEDNADARFLKAIIDRLFGEYGIDRRRVYCCGFSNGGMNTYAMANACSDVFAAFASISGFPLNEFHLRHTGRRPVPFLHIHGKNDDFVRYSLMPVIVDEMVARMGANPVPIKTTVSGKYDKSVYEAADGSFPYIYYEIDGMGHNDFTTNTEDGNSSLTMWKFFRQYTLDTPCDTTIKWMPRIETEGFTPKSHGWIIGSGKTLLAFGKGSKTDANQNVYHSLQLTNGRYKLCFRTTVNGQQTTDDGVQTTGDGQGDAGGSGQMAIGVKLQRFQPSAIVLKQTVPVGEDVTLYFDIEGSDFGQYRLTFTREDTLAGSAQGTTDDIVVSHIGIYSLTDGEATSMNEVLRAEDDGDAAGGWYSLVGLPSVRPAKGIYIRGGKKVLVLPGMSFPARL